MKKLNSIAMLSALVFALMPFHLLQAQNATLKLKEGDDVKLKFAQELSSKTASEGDTVNFVVADDVKVGDELVLHYARKVLTVRVLLVPERVPPALRDVPLYEVLGERREEPADWLDAVLPEL